jgi:hypothetical protein
MPAIFRLAPRLDLWQIEGALMNPILKIVIGVAVGGAVGYAFYRLVGCSTGGCPLTNNPWMSTFYGALLGGLMGSAFR